MKIITYITICFLGFTLGWVLFSQHLAVVFGFWIGMLATHSLYYLKD